MASRQPARVQAPRAEVLAFLQDIKEHPLDDTPRLILADWLEEHDDEDRAEFLRLQLRLAQLGKDPERPRLEEREGQLLAQNASGWLLPLQPTTISYRFHRGLLHLTSLSEKYLHSVLTALPGTEVSGWIDSLTFHGLREADVSKLLQGHPDAAAGGLGSLPLPGCLNALHLSGSQLGAAALSVLLNTPAMRCLVHLDHSWVNLGDATAEAVAGASLGQLQTLLLRGNGLTAAGVRLLASTPRLARLTTLNLARNRFGVEGSQALAESIYLTSVETLDLREAGIDDAGLIALASSAALRHLRSIDLDSNNIGDEGAEALAASPYLQQLVSVDLRGNRIGSRGALALARSAYLNEIECLQLYRNRLGEADVLRLRQRFGKKLWL